MKVDLIVVGAGPAGLMSAIRAAELGGFVLVCESMHSPLLKLGLTGKGMCNITNTAPLKDFLMHFNRAGNFLKPAFHAFFNNDLIDFFNNEGVNTVVERGGRVFPASKKSKEVVKCLVAAARKRGVKLECSCAIKDLAVDSNVCHGVITSSGKLLQSSNTILATGGKSYPATGSNGVGAQIAARYGHSIIEMKPSLVELMPGPGIPRELNGLKLKNICASLHINGKKVESQFGEMCFVDGYLGGPVIISLSMKAARHKAKINNYEIKIDLKPSLTHRQLDKRIVRDMAACATKTITEVLRQLLPQQLISFCLKQTELSCESKASNLTALQRRKLVNWVKQVCFTISHTASWKRAVITCGGVSTLEVFPKTLESKIIKNLYFAGEILDVDADTGGFNLQAAFSTGWLAGNSISRQ